MADAGRLSSTAAESVTVPVLAISGGASSVTAEKALMVARETADDVLPKPFSRQDLIDAVDKLIGNGVA